MESSGGFRYMACFGPLLKYEHFGYEAKNRSLTTYILNVGQWRHFSDIAAFWTLNLSSILHLQEEVSRGNAGEIAASEAVQKGCQVSQEPEWQNNEYSI